MAKTERNDRDIEKLLTPTVPRKKPRPARLWPKITNRAYVEAAKLLHHDEGTLEVDDNAAVSRSSDGGAYIQAWVWVGNEDVGNQGSAADDNRAEERAEEKAS